VVGFVLVVYHPLQLFEEVLCLTFERLFGFVWVGVVRWVLAHSSMQNQTIHACDYNVGHTYSSVVWEYKKRGGPKPLLTCPRRIYRRRTHT
jgi:hypothetical protein